MNVHAQPVGMQPDGVRHPFHSVDRVKSGMGMKDDLAVAAYGALSYR